MSKPFSYKKGDHWVECDRCSIVIRASKAKKEWTGLVVCPDCWEPRHPQDFVKSVPDHTKAEGLVRPESPDVFLPRNITRHLYDRQNTWDKQDLTATFERTFSTGEGITTSDDAAKTFDPDVLADTASTSDNVMVGFLKEQDLLDNVTTAEVITAFISTVYNRDISDSVTTSEVFTATVVAGSPTSPLGSAPLNTILIG